MNELLQFVVIGLLYGSVYALAGMGLTLTYTTSGVFNFAHGTIAAAVAATFFQLHVLNGWPWPVALLVCLLVVCPAAGLLLELLGRVLTTAPVVAKVIATLGILVGLEQLIVIRFGAAARQFPAFLPTSTFKVGSVYVGYDQLTIFIVGLLSAAGLMVFFRASMLGRQMRAVVDNADLVALTGTSPAALRRLAWCIGCVYVGGSGILLAPQIGLDSITLTLLVFFAFGASALGFFRSIPLTYVGGLGLGLAESLVRWQVPGINWLRPLPSTLPFIALFLVLVLSPKRKLRAVASERRLKVVHKSDASRRATYVASVAALVLALLVPALVGPKLGVYTTALSMLIVLLSLALLVRTSGQVSLMQLAFAALGATTFSHLAVNAGVPWFVALVLAGLATMPLGALIAIPAIRVSGLYLALATFGAGLLMERLAYPTWLMFGSTGSGGVSVPRPAGLTSDRAYYYLALACAVGAIAFVALIPRSRLGRLLRAMADSEPALEANGTSVVGLKIVVFCISAFLAGVGGAVGGGVTGQVSSSAYSTLGSVTLVVTLLMVGRRTEPVAAVLAAVALVLLPIYITNSGVNKWLPVVFGVAAILVAVEEARPERGRGAESSGLSSAAARRAASSPRRERLVQARAAAAAVDR